MVSQRNTIVEIAPKQLLTVSPYHFRIYFILCILLLLISMVTLIMFYIKLMSDDRQKPISKSLLIISLTTAIISMILILINLQQYHSIFKFHFSTMLGILLVILLFSIILIFTNVLTIVPSYIECDQNKTYSAIYNQCIPVCPPGYFLDTNKLICVSGCKGSTGCQIHEQCVNGICCDLNRNQITKDNICCPQLSVYNDGEMCCPSQNVCGNYCCLDHDATCQNNTCLVTCGDNVCQKDEICYQDENGQKSCVKYTASQNDQCKVTNTYHIPNLINGFFPATTLPSDLSRDRSQKTLTDKTLDCNFFDKYDESCKNDIGNAFAEANSDVYGYSCGVSVPVQFTSHLLEGQCTKEDFIGVGDNIRTDRINVNKIDDTHYVVNQRIDPRTKLNGSSDCSSLKTFQNDCSKLNECYGPNTCPFKNDNNEYNCIIHNDNVGVITEVRGSRCNFHYEAANPENKTTWIFTSTSSSSPLLYSQLDKNTNYYNIKGRDDSYTSPLQYLSAVGDNGNQAPSMQSKPWKWVIVNILKSSNATDNNVRSGDIVVIRSANSIPKSYFDDDYLSTSGSYSQPSMNSGKDPSSVSPGMPQPNEYWVLYDENYIEGTILKTGSPIIILKGNTTISNTSNTPFSNSAISLTNCVNVKPCMKQNRLRMAYTCVPSGSNNYDKRFKCPKNGQCTNPYIDPSTLTCSNIVSGSAKPLFCQSFDGVYGMCCDTMKFQKYLNDNPSFSLDVLCPNFYQSSPLSDISELRYCSEPTPVTTDPNDFTVQTENEKYWKNI